jgi:Zinc carboxypeptidase
MAAMRIPRCLRAITLGFLLAFLAAASLAQRKGVPSGVVTIATTFPGGNASEERNEGNSVHLSPDLRGDNPWFYWYFEATAVQPGRVQFVFPEKVAGFKNGAIGYQGPAISTDGGKTWKWMGTDTVKDNAFTYDFTTKGKAVRFAVTIPYVQSNLDTFLEEHTKNPHLKKSILTKSRGGREVELLRIGTPGPEKKALLLTARHHAAETIASYVLEGILEEAMADTADGKNFRKRHVLYAVPFVDKDGVENGDQGKNRKPHDHNRDYGEKSIYPEVRAIKKLQAGTGFRYALDLHCPTLVMKDHQVMYFVGAKSHPANNQANVSVFAERIKSGLPKTAPSGPLVWLRDYANPAPMCSQYFGTRDGVVMAATLEIPFAPPGKATDAASCRRYGRLILQAFVGTRFVSARPR